LNKKLHNKSYIIIVIEKSVKIEMIHMIIEYKNDSVDIDNKR
jgi:hypothetical protein